MERKERRDGDGRERKERRDGDGRERKERRDGDGKGEERKKRWRWEGGGWEGEEGKGQEGEEGIKKMKSASVLKTQRERISC